MRRSLLKRMLFRQWYPDALNSDNCHGGCSSIFHGKSLYMYIFHASMSCVCLQHTNVQIRISCEAGLILLQPWNTGLLWRQRACSYKLLTGPLKLCLNLLHGWPNNSISLYVYYQTSRIRWCRAGPFPFVSDILLTG